MPRVPRLSIELLDTLAMVVHQGGDAAAAAQSLNINQPSMSKRLAILQHSGELIRHPWIERNGKRWRLTEEGRTVWPAVEDIIRRYRQLSDFLELRQPAAERVAVACGQHSITTFVRRAVRELLAQRADVQVNVATMPLKERIVRVASGAVDLAIVTASADYIRQIAKRRLHVEEVSSDPLVLALSPSAPQAWQDAFTAIGDRAAHLEDLTRFPLIVPDRQTSFHRRLSRSLRQADLLHRVEFRVETGYWQTILSYVKEGLGVGLVTQSIVPPGGGLRTVALAESQFPAPRTAIVCRYATGSGTDLHLSDSGRRLYDLLVESGRTPRPLSGEQAAVGRNGPSSGAMAAL